MHQEEEPGGHVVVEVLRVKRLIAAERHVRGVAADLRHHDAGVVLVVAHEAVVHADAQVRIVRTNLLGAYYSARPFRPAAIERPANCAMSARALRIASRKPGLALSAAASIVASSSPTGAWSRGLVSIVLLVRR